MTQALTKADERALAAIPEHLREFYGNNDGKENVGQDDMVIPRIAVAQKNNQPQLDEDNELFIEGLKHGQLFNTVTGEIYGEEATVTPLFFFKNYIHFTPMDEGGGVVAQYADKSEVPAEGLRWIDEKPPLVTEFKNRMCVIADEDGRLAPVVVSFKSTGLKFAKKWNSLITLLPNLPAYAKQYTLKVVEQTKGNLKWYGINVFPGVFNTKEFVLSAKTYFDQLQAGGYKVDTTGVDGEETGDPSFDATTIDAQ